MGVLRGSEGLTRRQGVCCVAGVVVVHIVVWRVCSVAAVARAEV